MTSPKESKLSGVRYYLIAYNLLSALAWFYVFYIVATHVSGFIDDQRQAPVSVAYTLTSAFRRILGSVSYVNSRVTDNSILWIPSILVPFVARAKTTFLVAGWQTAFVQSFAILEVIHSAIGWVRSPVLTTLMQVTSRLTVVWAIAGRYEQAQINPIYASMVLSWSIAEVIRYSFYAANMLHYELGWLIWLRYNTFFVLYPTGACSEAALIFSTLPSRSNAWKSWDYGRALLFAIWWPSLYVLYTYMMKQRRRVQGVAVANHVASKTKKVH